MGIGAEKHAVANVMRAIIGEWPDVGRFWCWKLVFAGDGASALVSVGYVASPTRRRSSGT
jgi:hypothetical protein